MIKKYIFKFCTYIHKPYKIKCKMLNVTPFSRAGHYPTFPSVSLTNGSNRKRKI